MFSSSLLQIEFDRDPAIYYGSELLTGVVHLTTNELSLQNKQLSIELFGKATHEEIYDNNKDSRPKIHTIPFLSKNIILNQSSGDQEKRVVSDGRSSWSFEFELPKYAPPTFEVPHIFHKNHPAVEYTVVATLHRSLLNDTETKKIIFCPPLLLKPDAAIILSAVNKQGVEINVKLPQGLSYVAGEVIQGTIEINNPRNIQIKRVRCMIECILKVRRDRATNTMVDMTLLTIRSSTEKHLQGTFEIPIPESIPPTFDSAKCLGTIGVSVEVSYFITFEVCVVGLLSDFSLTEPLTITIDPWKHENDGTITLIDRAQSN